jgi:hypothetical protein
MRITLIHVAAKNCRTTATASRLQHLYWDGPRKIRNGPTVFGIGQAYGDNEEATMRCRYLSLIPLFISILMTQTLYAQPQAVDKATGFPYVTADEMFTTSTWTDDMRWAYTLGALDTTRMLAAYLKENGQHWIADLLWKKVSKPIQQNAWLYKGMVMPWLADMSKAALAIGRLGANMQAIYLLMLPWDGNWKWGVARK